MEYLSTLKKDPLCITFLQFQYLPVQNVNIQINCKPIKWFKINSLSYEKIT